MSSFGSARPCLKQHTIVSDGRQLILELGRNAGQLAFAADRGPILDLLDGKSTIREIVERLMARNGHVSFRGIFSTLQALEEGGALTEPLGLSTQARVLTAPTERAEAFFLRPLFELTLIRRLALPFHGLFPLVLIAALLISGVAGDTIYYWFSHLSTRGFLLLQDSAGNAGYLRALPTLAAMASILMVFKGLGKALLLLLATGRLYDLKLRVHLFGLSVGVSEVSINGASRPTLLAYFLGCVSLYICAAAVAPDYVRQPELVHSFELLAILLTLVELDAYRRSDLTLLIDRLFRDDDSRRMRAYLKNKALFSVATTGSGFGGELRLVVYSTLALAWTVGFGLFALELLATNYPNLVVAAGPDLPQLERVSAAAVLSLLLAAFGTLAFDLVSTIVSNIIYPMLTPYLRITRHIGTSEITSFDKDAMLARLKQLSFFEDLGEQALSEVIGQAKVKSFASGTRLIIQADPGRELFVLLEGSVRVLKRDETGLQHEICKLGSGSVFGEIALIRDCVRTADVVAAEPIQALVIEKEAFRKLLDESGFKNDFDRILNRIALGHYLSSTSIFCGMPAETLGIFRELGTFEHHVAGDVIIREGDEGRAFYLVLRGGLDVARSGTSIAELKQGDFFGEIALLSNVARTATVTCREESLLLKLEAETFWRVLSENLPLAMNLEMVAEQRQGAGMGT